MVTTTIRTFIGKFTFIHVGARISLATFPAHFTSSTRVLMVSILLTPIVSQWVRNKLLNLLHRVANLYFFRDFWRIECHNMFVSIVLPFLIETLLTSITSCLYNSLFLSRYTMTVLYSSPPSYLCSGICEGMFWLQYCRTLSFSRESLHVFFFPPQRVMFHFLIFFTDFGVMLLDMTFSIMNGETRYWRAFGFYSNESLEGRFYIFWISFSQISFKFFFLFAPVAWGLSWKIHIVIVWVSLTMLPTHHGAPFGDTPRGKPIRLGIPGQHSILMLMNNFIMFPSFDSQDNYSPRDRKVVGLSSAWLPSPSFRF